MRKVSELGIDKLKELEGVRNHMYLDSEGYPTIGVGHLLTRSENTSGKIYIFGQPVKWREGLTDQQVEDLLKQDLVSREEQVEETITVPLTQRQFEALVFFAFNVGNPAFDDSTLARLLNKGRYDQVPIQMRRWKYSGGRINQGLINRREKEIAWWESKGVCECCGQEIA